MSAHGNSGNRIKNLKGTSGCTHYRGLEADIDSTTKCAVNGCNNNANRACHVIYANQSSSTGTRYIVYMCASHNGINGEVFDIRSNAKMYSMTDCKCGTF